MVARYGRGLLFLLRRKTHDDTLAEDLYQETFRIAIEKLRAGGIEQPEKLASFLYGIATNLVIGHFRKERRHGTRADEETVARLPDQADRPWLQLSREQAGRIVRKLLDELKVPRDREILLRYYVEDEDKERICEELGLDGIHFNRVLFRAKQRFRELVIQAERRARLQLVPGGLDEQVRSGPGSRH